MSGYTIFMSLYKNGTNINSRQEVKICTKYLSLERAEWKQIMTMSEFVLLLQAKQETGDKRGE